MATTKRDLVKIVAERAALPQARTAEVVQLTLEAIADAIVAEGRLELRNFGVFEVKQRRARKARHPVTGAPLHVAPRQVVVFKPSDQLDQRVASS